MANLTFEVGSRVTLDLQDSAGSVTIRDWDEPVMRVAAEGASPYVLRDQDTFRISLGAGGAITLPAGLPADVAVPAAVQLRVVRETRGGGETVVRPVAASAGGSATDGSPPGVGPSGAAPAGAGGAPDINEFARTMSEYGRRIFADMTEAIRAGGVVPDDVTRRLEEAVERIDEQVRRTAERVQREADRAYEQWERTQEQAQRAAERAEAQARHIADRLQERAERVAQRAATRGWRADAESWARAGASVARQAARAGRGRWWFTEDLDEPPAPPRGAASRDERLAVLTLLQEGKITSEQAAKLLEALGT
jgi:hypothetical protein